MPVLRFGRHIIRIVTLLAVLLSANACSRAPFLYKRADLMLPAYVDNYVRLSGTQQKLMVVEVNRIRRWHCREQLPLYRKWLREVSGELLGNKVDVKRLREHEQKLLGWWFQLLRFAQPSVEKFLLTLDENQVRHAQARFEQNNKIYAKRNVAKPAKQQRRTSRTLYKRIREWTGKLSDEQQKLIEQAGARMQPTAKISLQMHKNWQQRLSQTMAARGKAGFSEKLAGVWVDYRSHWPTQYVRRKNHNHEIFFQLVTRLQKTLTPRQKQQLEKKVAFWDGELARMDCR